MPPTHVFTVYSKCHCKGSVHGVYTCARDARAAARQVVIHNGSSYHEAIFGMEPYLYYRDMDYVEDVEDDGASEMNVIDTLLERDMGLFKAGVFGADAPFSGEGSFLEAWEGPELGGAIHVNEGLCGSGNHCSYKISVHRTLLQLENPMGASVFTVTSDEDDWDEDTFLGTYGSAKEGFVVARGKILTVIEAIGDGQYCSEILGGANLLEYDDDEGGDSEDKPPPLSTLELYKSGDFNTRPFSTPSLEGHVRERWAAENTGGYIKSFYGSRGMNGDTASVTITVHCSVLQMQFVPQPPVVLPPVAPPPAVVPPAAPLPVALPPVAPPHVAPPLVGPPSPQGVEGL